MIVSLAPAQQAPWSSVPLVLAVAMYVAAILLALAGAIVAFGDTDHPGDRIGGCGILALVLVPLLLYLGSLLVGSVMRDVRF